MEGEFQQAIEEYQNDLEKLAQRTEKVKKEINKSFQDVSILLDKRKQDLLDQLDAITTPLTKVGFPFFWPQKREERREE